MRILFNNVDFYSNSGPNNFAFKLAHRFQEIGHEIVRNNPDVCLNFIQGNLPVVRNVLRLDGIYFNTTQDWKRQNEPIIQSYNLADAVIVQSNFNKELVTRYFGHKDKVHVINNGTDFKKINQIKPAVTGFKRENVWFCASSWRPHKRLSENIKYFQSHAKTDDVLFVAGSGDVSTVVDCDDPRVKYVGNLEWDQMISVMKSAANFIHLAFLDHCPNVVIDARASGCNIICASSGGTKEIAGKESIVVKDLDWDYRPLKLYDPPKLDFSKTKTCNLNSDINIATVADIYAQVLKGVS